MTNKRFAGIVVTMFILFAAVFVSAGCDDKDSSSPAPTPNGTFTVTFDSNGGSHVEDVRVPSGGTIVAPENPTREGYVFVGWFKDREFTQSFAFGENGDKVTADITLYARWVTLDEIQADYAVSEIVIGYAEGDNPNYVTQNLTLPVKIGSADILWSTSSTAVSTSGNVTRQANDTDVILTARSSYNGKTSEPRTFTVKVIRRRTRDNSTIKPLTIDRASSGDISVTRNESGDVTEIEGQYVSFDIRNADDALDAVTVLRDELGISSPDKELKTFLAASGRYGAEYSFRQMYKGVEVYGRSLMASVNSSGKGDFLHSSILASNVLDGAEMKVNLTAAQAESIAVSAYSGDVETDTERTERIVYSLENYANKPVYAYVVRIYGTSVGEYVDDDVFVNADTGQIIINMPNMVFNTVSADGKNESGDIVSFDVFHNKGSVYAMYDPELHVKIHDHQVFLVDLFTPPIVISRTNTWNDPVAVSAYTNMREIMKWWKNRFGRDSLDDKGKTVDVVVHASKLFGIGKSNAAWNHSLAVKKLWITDKKDGYKYTEASDIEVLTHETAHAVLQYITSCCLTDTNNIYVSSLNEGYADIFACIKAEDWQHGGHSGIVAYEKNFECYRDLANPYNENSLAGYQLKVLKKNPKEDVHLFGLLFVGHVAYLMHQENNPSNGLTWDELAKVWYESMHMGLDTTSDFYDVRRCVIWAAMKINLSAEKIAVIKAAFDEVGITEARIKGTVSGTVRDIENRDKVLAGVRVTAFEEKLSDDKINLAMAGRAFTTSRGWYSISLEAGKYTLSFDKAGYISESVDAEIASNEDVEVNMLMKPAAVLLSGTIRSASDNSYIAGATVRVRRAGNDEILKSTITNATGQYSLDLTQNGIGLYTVEASKEGYKSASDIVTLRSGAVVLDLTLETESEDIPIDKVHFPDENFRAYVSSNFDTDKNLILSAQERARVTYMSVRVPVESLQGIEYFTALQELHCQFNGLTTLDVSKNTAMQILYCSNNKLTALDVSGCVALQVLRCGYNQLTVLNVSNCAALQSLYCYDNKLTALDVSNNPELQVLHCYNNQIAALDVSKNAVLQDIHCRYNQLTVLDVSQNVVLKQLYCANNQLAALNVGTNTALQELECHTNQLAALDVSGCPTLRYLSCRYNQFTTLDLSKCLQLSKSKVTADSVVIITWPSSTTSATQSSSPDAQDSPQILAVIPAFTPSTTCTYSFNVQLNRTPPEGSSLALLADSEDLDASFAFMDSPDVVMVSADFTAGRLYTPVIAATHEDESQNGGCNAGAWSIMIFLAGICFAKK